MRRRGLRGHRLLGVEGFELGGRMHASRAVQATVVEPVHVRQGGIFHVIEPTPGAGVPDQLGLVEAIEGFGQGIIVAVAARADRDAAATHLLQAAELFQAPELLKAPKLLEQVEEIARELEVPLEMDG